MTIKVETFCPIGKVCEEAAGGTIRRCNWYLPTVQLVNGVPDESTRSNECAIPMVCVHLAELKQKTGGVQAAVENRMNKVIELAANSHRMPVMPYEAAKLEQIK